MSIFSSQSQTRLPTCKEDVSGAHMGLRQCAIDGYTLRISLADISLVAKRADLHAFVQKY